MSALHAGDARDHPPAVPGPSAAVSFPISSRYIRSPEPLAGLLARLRGADRVALDTEADSLYHYREKVCVFQLSFSGDNYIVDPLAGLDLAELVRVLEEKPLHVDNEERAFRRVEPHLVQVVRTDLLQPLDGFRSHRFSSHIRFHDDSLSMNTRFHNSNTMSPKIMRP